ncbi:unnamed protein product [Phaedon cochleariae]|uniref:PHD-type domain-containing protein n=1 Tax=Phaedon cochleariae TaxID=80249 RepID=A0A9P0GTQ9_PHACE|nr:unnamed protein product [Phaedon cochleariae]
MNTKLNDDENANLLRTNSICPTPETELLDMLTACSKTNVKPEIVKALIDLGANLTYSNEEEWQAIHCAAHATNSSILKVVIDCMKRRKVDINTLQQGNNALHVLIKFGKSASKEQFNECAKILVEEGINVNLGDGKDISPILWAAGKGYKDVIKTILEKSPISVDLDSHKLRGKTAREIITSGNLYEGQLPEKIIDSNDRFDVLLKLIKTKNESGFIKYENDDIYFVDSNNTSKPLLQMACEKGLTKVVKHLIDKGADPYLKVKIENSYIKIAAEHGFHEIFKLLLNHYPKDQKPHLILTTLFKYYENKAFPEAGKDWTKCYRHFMEYIKRRRGILDTNKLDQSKNSPLHFKTNEPILDINESDQSENSPLYFEKNEDILDINELDQSKNSPLHYAMRYCEPEITEELLALGASLGAKNKFGVMPVQDMEPEKLEKHLDQCIQIDTEERKEKEDLRFTFNYRTLIPPEISFGSVGSRELLHETEVISYMSKAPEFKHLLTHPVIVSFLFMKWHRIRWLFYTNLTFYIAFFASLVVFIFTSYANVNPEDSLKEFFGMFSWITLLVTWLILLLRELFQVAVSPTKYFKNFENYIELVLIFITGFILFIPSPSEDTKKQLSAISILLAAFELVLLSGQHPKLSTNFVILRTVSYNFFKFLIWYSLLIIAFALSFYILFTNTQSKQGDETSEQKNEDFFKDPGISMFKTIVMLTGEFDLNFHTFPIMSKLIFVLFIFMIVIILMNLLNALAVSDTQIIKNDAELLGHIYRTQHIMYVESVLLGNILLRIILNKIKFLFCCCPFDIENTLLQPNKYEMKVSPNNDGQIEISVEDDNGSCSNIHLDKDTIRRTMSIVQARKQREIREKTKLRHELADTCGLCDKSCKNSFAIACNQCSIRYHIKCVDLTTARLNYYAADQWFCRKCKREVTTATKNQPRSSKAEQRDTKEYTINDIMHKLVYIEQNYVSLLEKFGPKAR